MFLRFAVCVSVWGLALLGLASGDPETIAREFMAKTKVPGLAYLVLQNGAIVSRGALGVSDTATKEPVTLTSVFPIASLSKPFVAFGMLALAEGGKLKLEDPVGKYLPDLPDDWKPISLVRLLDHTSGVPDHFNSGKFPVFAPDRIASDELIKKLVTLPLHFKPGEKYEYSNGNYALLAKVIEKVSGQPYEAYLSEKIFAKLGMKDTKALVPDDLAKCVHGYGNGAHGVEARSFNPDWCYGNGALGSTVLDLAKLDTALYSQKLLKTSTLNYITTPHALNDGKLAPYAMGWAISTKRGARLIDHNGRVGGWQSYFGRYADQSLTVIVLSNNRDVDLSGLAADLAGTLSPALSLQPIRDDYQAMTQKHRAFVDAIVAGNVDVAALGEGLQKDYESKDHWSGLQQTLKSGGAFTRFVPVERKVMGQGAYMSKYRLEQGDRVWSVAFYFNDNETVTGFMLGSA